MKTTTASEFLNYHHLRYFWSVAREGSLRAASVHVLFLRRWREPAGDAAAAGAAGHRVPEGGSWVKVPTDLRLVSRGPVQIPFGTLDSGRETDPLHALAWLCAAPP
jgi:hypothetical protein